jgi:hypothetical protein
MGCNTGKLMKRLRTQNRGVSDKMTVFNPKNARGEGSEIQFAAITRHIMRTYHGRIENV